MRILHICLASAYTEGMSYQENLLSDQNIKDGHNVTIISDCHKYINGKIEDVPPEDRVLENGLRIIRMKYKNIISKFISSKVLSVNNMYSLLEELNPDVILYHGCVGFELRTIAKYKKHHNNIRLYIDSHEDFNNSGRNILSRLILYRFFNNLLMRIVLPYVDKIFYISQECKIFLKQMYHIPEKVLEYYPLGGIIFDDTIWLEKRRRIRNELQLVNDDLLIVHSGKMDKLKRSDEILKAFKMVPSNKLKLILIGTMTEDVNIQIQELITTDERISFLGWKKTDELLEYLCGCDLYIQPGGQSATMQNALCCGCAVALFPYKSHKYLLKDNAFYVETIEDIKNVFMKILIDNALLGSKKKLCFNIAQKKLDYRILAKRLYE